MADKQSVTVTIYKNEYTLKGDADPQHIKDLAKFVDAKMTELGKKSAAPADKIAILVSMNIADDLQRLEKTNEQNVKMIEDLLTNVENMKANFENATKNTVTLKEQVEKLTSELLQEKRNLEAAHSEVSKLGRELNDTRNRAESLTKEVEHVKNGLQGTKAETLQLQNVLDEERKKARSLEHEFLAQRAKAERLELELLEARRTVDKLQEAEVSAATARNNDFVATEEKLTQLFRKIDAALD
jgi:cell division protein ZapA